jgi:hypothetical protein
MKIGSEEHKNLFCRSFIESHREYQPQLLPWPHLDSVDIDRLRKIPFWQEALNTELDAGTKINAYTQTITDRQVREAIALQGYEEVRHGQLLQYMIQHYDIELKGKPLKPLPNNIEPAFIEFGYGECIDSFLGFGLFKIARQANFLPEAMFDIFDVLLQEEARHIVFFVNWIAYLQASRGRGAKLFRSASSLWEYGKATRRIMGVVNGSVNENGDDFAITEANVFMDDFSVEKLLSECLSENKRRMNSFDEKLIKPQLLPILARIALSGLQLFSRPSWRRENIAT